MTRPYTVTHRGVTIVCEYADIDEPVQPLIWNVETDAGWRQFATEDDAYSYADECADDWEATAEHHAYLRQSRHYI